MFRKRELSWWVKTLFVFILLLLVFSLSSFKLYTDNQLIQSIQLQVRELANKNIKLIETQLQLYERDIDIIEHDFTYPLEAEHNRRVIDQSIRMRKFDHLVLLDKEGEVLYQSGVGDDLQKKDMPADFSKLDRVSNFEDDISILNVIEENGKLLGYIWGTISADTLSEKVRLTSYDEKSFANLITEDGFPLIVSSKKSTMRPDGGSIWEDLEALDYVKSSNYEKVQFDIKNNKSDFMQYRVNGRERIAYYSPVGVDGWYILQIATEDAIQLHTLPIQDIVVDTIILISLISALAFFTILILNELNRKKLMEAQTQIEKLTNNIRGGVMQFSVDKEGRIEYISAGYLKILGATHEDIAAIYQNSFYEMICEEDRQNVRNELDLKSLYANKEINLEYRVRSVDGHPIWVMDKVSVIADAERRYKFYSIVVDATSVKEKEEGLRFSNQSLSLVAGTHLESRVFEFDLESGEVHFHQGGFLGYNLSDYNGITVQSMMEWNWSDEQSQSEIIKMFDHISDSGNGFSSGFVQVQHAITKEPRWVRIMLTKIEEGNGLRVIGSVRDVTEERETQLKLSRVTERNKLMISGALFTGTINVTRNKIVVNSDGKGLKNHENTVYDYIRRLQVIIGTLIHPEDVEAFLGEFNTEALFRHYNTGSTSRTIEYRRRIEGKVGYFWVRATMRLTKDATSGDIMCFVYVNDIDRDIKIAQMLRQKAETDYLTGLFNREGLIKRIENHLSSSPEEEINAFYSMDLDDFKQLNDNFGHIAGDDLLRLVGKQLTSMFRKDDLIGRMGGDEFVVFLRSCPSEEFVYRKAQAILERISEIKLEGIDYECKVSVGVALSPKNGRDFTSLYDASDKALYTAKKAGKDAYSVYLKEELDGAVN